MPKPFQLAAKVPEVDPNRGYFKKPDSQVVDHSSVGNRFGFQGRPQDPETGFVYFRNRYYDPELGRFLTPDPLGHADGPNPYPFSGSDPLDKSDPMGLCVGAGCADLQAAWMGIRAHQREERRRQRLKEESDRALEAALREAAEVQTVVQRADPKGDSPQERRLAILSYLRGTGKYSLRQIAFRANFYMGRVEGLCHTPSDRLSCNLASGEAAMVEPYEMLYVEGVNTAFAGLGVAELSAMEPLGRSVSYADHYERIQARVRDVPLEVGNPVPKWLARVIPGEGPFTTLGRASVDDVFVTAAEDIQGFGTIDLSERLTIPVNDVFTIIEFPAPSEGLASPVFRSNPGFVGFARTAGGAREFVVPNGPIPPGATVRVLKP